MQECAPSVARCFEFSEVKYLNIYEKSLDLKMSAANSDFKKHDLGQHPEPSLPPPSHLMLHRGTSPEGWG